MTSLTASTEATAYGRLTTAALCLAVMALGCTRADAQYIDLHTMLSHGSVSRTQWQGVGIGMFVASADNPIHATLGANVDYSRQEGLGPGHGSLSLDLNVFPLKDITELLPHIGVSVSANVSGGPEGLWAGTSPGMEGIVGVSLPFGSALRSGWSLEERIGSVRGQERFFTTRLALNVGL